MDPGEGVFQTLYGLDHIIEIGENTRDYIKKRLFKIDKLKSKLEQPKRKVKKKKKQKRRKKYKYKKAINRHHKKLEHFQEELHNKTALYLCKNYERIMVTDFSSKKVSKKNGNLNVLSKRVLGKLSHYRFRQKLQNKCLEYGCQYLEVNEYYTSKTCCNCGTINNNLGASRVYNCEKCKQEIKRDINGAICILIKNHEFII